MKYLKTIMAADLDPLSRKFYRQTDNPNFGVANVLSFLTCCCALSPRLVFRYPFDRAMHHLLLQLIIVGQSSDGKSFSRDVYKLMMKPLLDMDKQAEIEELEYAEMKRTKGQSKDKPREPITVKRCLMKFTKNKIVKRAHMFIRKYGEALSFFIFTDELSTLVERRGSYGDLRDIGKLAYDWGSETSVDTNCDASYNATVDINWCSIYCSTPKILYKYLDRDACESGNVNRIIFASLGDLLGEPAPMFKQFTEDDMRAIRELQDRLMKETYDENGMLRPVKTIDMGWLDRDIKIWCERQRDIINKTCSNAHNCFYKRASTSAARLAAMVYHLWGEDPKQRKHVRKVYYFFADYILDEQMHFFGKMYEKAIVNITDNSSDDAEENVPLYDQMPKRFTRDQLKARIEQLELGTKARQFIFKWLRKNLIFEVEGEKNTYEKLY